MAAPTALPSASGDRQLEQPDPAQRPEAQESLTLYLLLRHGAEEARVAGVSPVVSHHENVALRNRRRGEEAPVGELFVHVGLPSWLAVHEEFAASDRDLVPRSEER